MLILLGGAGLSTLETALVVEALAYACTGIQLAIMGPSLAMAPIYIAGTEVQKKKYLGMLAAEPFIAVIPILLYFYLFLYLLYIKFINM